MFKRFVSWIRFVRSKIPNNSYTIPAFLLIGHWSAFISPYLGELHLKVEVLTVETSEFDSCLDESTLLVSVFENFSESVPGGLNLS